MTRAQPASQEIFLQVLNLADGEIKVTVLGSRNNSLLVESVNSFQVRHGPNELELVCSLLVALVVQ